MAWDPSLLRKYNITSHFRLLNQVRSELRDQPLQRPLPGARPEPSSRRGNSARSADGSGRRRSSSGRASTAGGASAFSPVKAISPQPPAPESSFDPIVLVPLLTDAFDGES
jgi:hypothetical protein